MKNNSGRVSFAGLKNERNKQNELSFNNMKHTFVQNSHSQNLQSHSSPTCPKGPNPYIVPIKNNSGQQNKSSVSSTRFADAIREKNSYGADWQALQQKFQRAQNRIKAQIQECNSRYTSVTEMVADLHIKDLMKFNQMLERNQDMYCRWVEEEEIRAAGNFYLPTFEDHRIINQIEKSIMTIVSQKGKSFDCRSTYQSKNKKTVSGQSSRVSPQLVKQSCSPLRMAKHNSQDSQNLAESLRQPQKLTPKQSVSQKNPLQDTPQSVKSKISQTSKIKTEKVPIIGMFDRINICESVQHQDMVEKVESMGSRNSDRLRGKSNYRYGTSSQQ